MNKFVAYLHKSWAYLEKPFKYLGQLIGAGSLLFIMIIVSNDIIKSEKKVDDEIVSIDFAKRTLHRYVYLSFTLDNR